jgi:hypothetical protein
MEMPKDRSSGDNIDQQREACGWDVEPKKLSKKLLEGFGQDEDLHPSMSTEEECDSKNASWNSPRNRQSKTVFDTNKFMAMQAGENSLTDTTD